MKVQIRRSTFETNSSSTHALAIFDKERWDLLCNGKAYCDYHCENIVTEDELRKMYEEAVPVNERDKTTFDEWRKDEWYTGEEHDDYLEERGLECTTCKTPDGSYTAISIYGYEY